MVCSVFQLHRRRMICKVQSEKKWTGTINRKYVLSAFLFEKQFVLQGDGVRRELYLRKIVPFRTAKPDLLVSHLFFTNWRAHYVSVKDVQQALEIISRWKVKETEPNREVCKPRGNDIHLSEHGNLETILGEWRKQGCLKSVWNLVCLWYCSFQSWWHDAFWQP